MKLSSVSVLVTFLLNLVSNKGKLKSYHGNQGITDVNTVLIGVLGSFKVFLKRVKSKVSYLIRAFNSC